MSSLMVLKHKMLESELFNSFKSMSSLMVLKQ